MGSRRRPTTPLWLKVLLLCAVVGPLAWYVAAWRDRAGNEQRLSVVASEIAGPDHPPLRVGAGTDEDVALAVYVLAHEMWHLAGIGDEAVTECQSMQTLAWATERLGVLAGEGAGSPRCTSRPLMRRCRRATRAPSAATGASSTCG